jgi:DNA-directed RNA polymerase subunit RPC12/RpoP
MPVTTLYSCNRCKREVDFDSIKYDENNKLICVECLGKQQKIERKEKLSLEKAGEGESVNFICVSCRFKFSIRKGTQKEAKCPYCSKTRLMLVKRYKDENDLINDSMDPRFDY